MLPKITSEQWFDAVKQATNHWDRVNDRCLVLWFSGYKCSNYFQAQQLIGSLGGFFLKVEFDSMCGKTRVLVREPKCLKPETHEV